MADALSTLEINMHHENIRPRRAQPDNEIERAAILLPEHAAIYRDSRFVAVAWSVDPSDRTTAQVMGSQRRCLPFLALARTCRSRLGISATAWRARDRALPTRGELIATEFECPQCDGQRPHEQARYRATRGHNRPLVIRSEFPELARLR
jgi:hypothetical protein